MPRIPPPYPDPTQHLPFNFFSLTGILINVFNQLSKNKTAFIWKFAAFALSLQRINVFIMARPIKETPILYGAEARQFEMRMMNPEPVSKERQEAIYRDYEFMRTKCVNCSF